jgi:hypothetical protein
MSMTVLKLKNTMILYFLFFIGFGIFQIVKTFNPVTSKTGHEGYNWKESQFVYKNIAVEETWKSDSIGTKFTSDLCFFNQYYNPKSDDNMIKLNLLDPKYKHIPKLFSLYYLYLSCLWGFILYYFYKLIRIFYRDQVFNTGIPDILKKLGKIFVVMSFSKWFGLKIIILVLSFWKDVHLSDSYDYDETLDWIFMALIGNILLMLCNAFNKGITLEKEQELVI